MKELLQKKDSGYYRSVQLLIAHAELQQLSQWRVDAERRSKISLGMCRSPKNCMAKPSRQRMKPQSARALPHGYSTGHERASARSAHA
jgi:hypothetical protein